MSNIAYTASFTLNGETLIQKGTTDSGAIIPNGISVRSISIWPTKVDGSYPTYYVKGMDFSSSWVIVESGIFNSGSMADGSTLFFYIRSTSEITMNIAVKGD